MVGPSAQASPADMAAFAAQGYKTVVNNRPDGEIPHDLQNDQMSRAAQALGLTFVTNPLMPGNFTPENIALQSAALAGATGPVFAYCASGNRSSVVWALAHAGQMPADDLIGIPARFGYQLEHLRPTLEQLAKG